MNHWKNGRPILDNLPGFLGRYNRNDVANWVTNYYDELLVTLKGNVDRVKDYLYDLESAPDEMLDFYGNLAGFIGEYWSKDYSRETKIALIRRANWIFANKGSKEVLSYILNSFAIENIIINDSSFIIGTNVVGDILGVNPWSFIIYVNPNQNNVERLNLIPEICRLYAPIWCRYRIIEDYSRFIKFRILGYALNDTGYAFIDDLQRFISASSAIEGGLGDNSLSPTVEDYRTRLEAVGFTRNLSFWVNLDNMLSKLDLDNVEYLTLFLGDTLAQKLVPIIEPDPASVFYYPGGNVNDGNDDGLVFENDSTLLIKTANDVDYVVFDIFSVTLNPVTNGLTDIGAWLDTDTNNINREIYFQNTGGDFYQLIYDSEDYEFSYPPATTFAGNFIFEANNISYNNQIYLTHPTGLVTKTDFIVGSTVATPRGFEGNLRYCLAARGSRNDAVRNSQIICDYLASIGKPVDTTRYHLDLFSYAYNVQDASGTLAVSTMDSLNTLINNMISVGVYEKLRFFYPFATNNNNGITVGIRNNCNIVNLDSYNIVAGIKMSQNVVVNLNDIISKNKLDTDNYTDVININIPVINSQQTQGIFGFSSGSLRYGTSYNLSPGFINYGIINFYGMGSKIDEQYLIPFSTVFRGSNSISVDNTGNNTTYKFYLRGLKEGEKTQVNPNFLSQDMKVQQLNSVGGEPFYLHSFLKFDLLTDDEIQIVSQLIANFNRSLGRRT